MASDKNTFEFELLYLEDDSLFLEKLKKKTIVEEEEDQSDRGVVIIQL